MFVFLDESGSFVSPAPQGSWNVITAYVMPEIDEIRTREALAELRNVAGAEMGAEIKLKHIEEHQYFEFLKRLDKCHGVLFAVATDSGLSTIGDLESSREDQARGILAHESKMKHEAGRQALRSQAERVGRLSLQLFVQLKCQVILMDSVLRYGSLYFVQRLPSELGRFAWRIDQKSSNRTEYEKAFRTLTPAWLQSMTLRNPIMTLEGANYTAFKRFDFPQGQAPTYLRDQYGYDIGDTDATNIGKLIREDFEFVDSVANFGVQIADFLSAGLRRCLRQRFENNEQAAHLLGRLMPQGQRGVPPVKLLGFSGDGEVVRERVAKLVWIMAKSARPMLR